MYVNISRHCTITYFRSTPTAARDLEVQRSAHASVHDSALRVAAELQSASIPKSRADREKSRAVGRGWPLDGTLKA